MTQEPILYVGLPKNHIWQSAGSYAKKADRFVANIPTEEVFYNAS